MSITNPVIYSIDDLRKAASDLGSHYFDADTMRFFGSRVLEGIYRPSITTHPRTGLFVTSERRWDDVRRYSIRRFTITRTTRPANPEIEFDAPREIDVIEFDTIGEFGGFNTAATAKRRAAKLAQRIDTLDA